LTPTTTIREAGGAILVDFFAVTSPYRIEAIGDPDRLLTRFVDSRVGQQYQTYVGAYQIRFDVQRRDAITMQAAAGTDVQHATVVPEPTPSGGASVESGSPAVSRSGLPAGSQPGSTWNQPSPSGTTDSTQPSGGVR